MTSQTSTIAACGGTPRNPDTVTDHPIRFDAPRDVRAWLAGCGRLLPIAIWMGDEEWGVRTWDLQQAARSGRPIPLEGLEAIRALIGLERADTPWSSQALWLQGVDLDDPWVIEACALYESLEAACAALRRAARTSGTASPSDQRRTGPLGRPSPRAA